MKTISFNQMLVGRDRRARRGQRSGQPKGWTPTLAHVGVQALACFVLLVSAHGAPLPDNIRDAVQQLRKYDFTQSHDPVYALVQFTPRADAEQRPALAALLAQAVVAPDTTPLGRTILCQQLALVAGDAEKKMIAPLLNDPKTAQDARIVLQPLGALPATPEKAACLAQVSDAKPATRIAGLASLARFYPGEAVPVLVKAMNDDVAFVSATAIQLAGKLDGAALAAQLPKFDASRQVLALGVLAEHKVATARSSIAELANCGNELVRLAAISALGAVGDAGSVPVLAKIAAEEKSAVKTAAENALGQLTAPGVDEAILAGIRSGQRGVMINAAAVRSLSAATPLLLAAARVSDATVQEAALKALGKLGDAAAYAQLVEWLAGGTNPALEEAVIAVGRRIGGSGMGFQPMNSNADGTHGQDARATQARVAPLLALLKRAGTTAETQAAVLRTLGSAGGDEALAAVRERLATSDAAVRALADWPDAEALEDLCKLVEQPATKPVHRALALRGLLRLAPTSGQAVSWLKRAQPLLKTTAEKRQWLGAVSELKDPAALALAEEMTSDAEVTAEAKLAADKVNVALGGKSQHAEARRAALAKALPAGAKLVAYLDCGAEVQDRSGSVKLRVTHGQNWAWKGAGDPAALTVAFAGGHVDFEAAGLDEKKSYSLGFTWWDCDENGRAQSVEAGGQTIVAKTALPGREKGPATLTRAIPAAAIRGGRTTIVFKQEAKSNCVVSELWLIEGTVAENGAPGGRALPAAPVAASQMLERPDNSPVATPVVKANAGAAKKILIGTGLEYPGHKWRETVPVLTEAIGADKRMEVSVVEDPRFMASGTGILPVSAGQPKSGVLGLEAQATGLLKYDAFVLNYQNHNVPAPNGALAGLKSAVEGGRGLVLFHFACGAFIDWTTKIVAADFLSIAGRVWNPKLRGHDPRGPFKVNITDAQHPITKGLADFDTEDELYTCLDDDVPMQVLAKATSKVDKKDYPMAFVLTPGKGRTFHCVLGHDVKALNAAVQQLYRRGTAWTVGLEPQN